MNNYPDTDHMTASFSKVLLCIMMSLFMCQQISAITKTVYVDDNTGTDHYATLSAALTDIHKLEAPRNIRIELSKNYTETNDLGFNQTGDNITIVATGTRHAVTFKKSSTRMMYVSSGATLTLGGQDSKTLIFKTAENGSGCSNKTLIKVKDGTLNIKDNVELAYGNGVLWLDTDNSTDPAPVVNMSGGVIHSGINWCVNITKGIFNMSGGYICGKYQTGTDAVPAAIGPDGSNRILNIANTEAAFKDKNVLDPGDIYNYLNDFYGSNYTCGGVVVYSNSSHFNMSGGSISGIFTNVSGPDNSVITGYSGGDLQLVSGIKRVPVYVNRGSFNFSGGSIHTNYTVADGGAFNMSYYKYDPTTTTEKYDYATTTMSGNALIAYCECLPNGGAARVEKATTFEMQGGKITMCTCGRTATEKNGGGGAIRVVAAKFIMSGNAEISNCYSPGNGENYSGGAIGAVVSSTYGKIPTVLELNGGKIHHNVSKTYGGGISATDKGTDGKQKVNVTINGTEIYENTAQKNSGGGIYIGGRSNVTIDGGAKIHDNTAKEYGGGIYLGQTGKSSEGSVTAITCEIFNNHALDGGGIYTDYAPVTIKEGTKIYSHTIKGQGAGICLNHEADYVQTGGSIYGNKSSESIGGGVCVLNGTAKITGGNISGNEAALDGGGIYLLKGSLDLGVTENINLTNNPGLASEENAYVHDNKSSESGGGFYVANGNVFITNAAVEKNISDNGGGIFVASTATKAVVKLTGGSMIGNEATNGNGGAFNVSSKGATITVSGTEIKDNTASANGGAFYLADESSMTITNGTVSGNKSTGGDGGAFYASTGALVKLSGGSIESNEALSGNGGGIFATGTPATGHTWSVNLTGGTISGNQAGNGGGVYLTSGAKMQYNESGYLYDNEAKGTTKGLGGGVFLDNGASESAKTTLSFNLSDDTEKPFGYYGNVADTGGDDIYATGTNTNIVLPDITKMTLDKYKYPGAKLTWYEDYRTDDSDYGKGTNLKDPTDGVRRYRIARDAGQKLYGLEETAEYLSSIAGKYLALAVGYELGKIKIIRQGLVAGESAVYEVKSINGGIETLVQQAYILGTDQDKDNVILNNMPLGKYRVYETSWTWYDKNQGSAGVQNYIEKDLFDNMATPFEFANEHKPEHGENATPQHDERVIDVLLSKPE